MGGDCLGGGGDGSIGYVYFADYISGSFFILVGGGDCYLGYGYGGSIWSCVGFRDLGDVDVDCFEF